MSRLVVDDVTVTFAERAVLDGASLQVASGEVVALLGPSGCGKSTLLRVVAGILEPDSGRVVIDDVEVTAVPPHRRNVGLVFQDNQLFPHKSVLGNVAFSLEMHGVGRSERRDRARTWLRRVGLEEFAGRTVESLSGGEAKRVALARTLVAEPRVLLLDEPLTGLDRELHDRLADDIAVIVRATGTTTVLVTHDHDEAATIADRVVSIDQL